jgi:hypothetical protein
VAICQLRAVPGDQEVVRWESRPSFGRVKAVFRWRLSHIHIAPDIGFNSTIT